MNEYRVDVPFYTADKHQPYLCFPYVPLSEFDLELIVMCSHFRGKIGKHLSEICGSHKMGLPKNKLLACDMMFCWDTDFKQTFARLCFLYLLLCFIAISVSKQYLTDIRFNTL